MRPGELPRFYPIPVYEERDTTLASEIYKQESEDFPKKSIKWILSKNVKWAERTVPLSQIDFSNAKNWPAYKNEAHVQEFVKLIKDKGYDKPVILVRSSGTDKLLVIDGHHRALAYRKLRKPVHAYVGTVDKAHGPWDKMHDVQIGSNQPRNLALNHYVRYVVRDVPNITQMYAIRTTCNRGTGSRYRCTICRKHHER